MHNLPMTQLEEIIERARVNRQDNLYLTDMGLTRLPDSIGNLSISPI
jgi:hypothetical protein